MEPIKISLKDYKLFGGGANGESYDCISDPDLMLKLYFLRHKVQISHQSKRHVRLTRHQ